MPELPKLEGDLHDSLESEDLFRPLSDMERDLDKTSRLQVLLRLLQLACAMVRHLVTILSKKQEGISGDKRPSS